MTIAANEVWHGTTNGYSKKKCRCERCAQAWRDYSREWARRKRANAQPLATDDIRHGSAYGYSLGCRCDPCREAKADSKRRSRPEPPARPEPPKRAPKTFANKHHRTMEIGFGRFESAPSEIEAVRRLVDSQWGGDPELIAMLGLADEG